MKLIHWISTLGGLMLSAQLFAASITPQSVLDHYADLAHTMYTDSLITAQQLQKSVNQLIAKPTTANLQAAKDAWVAARHPYQQTEAYRY